VIFDLDGVLVFTDSYHYRAWKRLAERESIPFDESINHRLRGVSRCESLAVILENAQRPYREEEKQAMMAQKNLWYRESLQALTPADLPPEVVSTLQALRARGCKLAVGSSSKNAGLILKKTGLDALLDAVADGNDSANSKPAPDIFLIAAQKLGADPAACLVVEDAPAGIHAGKAAGMRTAGIGAAKIGCDADDALESLSDLLTLLPPLNETEESQP